MAPNILAPLPSPNAMLIQSLAPMLMIGGVVVVILALGPVRRAFSRAAARMERASRPQVVLAQQLPDEPPGELDRFDIDTIYDN